MERLSKRLLISLSAVLLLAGTASAELVCTNDTNFHQYICHDTFGPMAGDSNTTVLLPQFDPSLGALLKIEHFASATVEGTFTITNKNSTTKPFTLNAVASVTMMLGDETGEPLVTVMPSYSGVVLVPGLTTTSPPILRTADASEAGTTYDAPFSAAVRGDYIGSGFVPFYISVSTMSGVLGSPPYDASARATTSGIAEVIYTYTDIPEPTTILLIGSSLLAIGFRRKLKTVSA